MFDPRPLYCNSLTTAVGGTKDTNIVDSKSRCCPFFRFFLWPLASCFVLGCCWAFSFLVINSYLSKKKKKTLVCEDATIGDGDSIDKS